MEGKRDGIEGGRGEIWDRYGTWKRGGIEGGK
jgi:hypothetical protein